MIDVLLLSSTNNQQRRLRLHVVAANSCVLLLNALLIHSFECTGTCTVCTALGVEVYCMLDDVHACATPDGEDDTNENRHDDT